MLIIGDSRRGGGRVVVLSVFLSVCASVGATVLLHDALDHGDAPARTVPASPRVVLVDGAEEEAAPLPSAEAIAALEEEVARLRRAIGAEPEAGLPVESPGVAPLLAIEQGERQMAILEEVRRLVEGGDAVVPEVVGALKAGRDLDWGGGYSFGGNMFRGYPRLRTALIDVLRQIGTPAATEGLLDALATDASATDYRDLLLGYGTTHDPAMVAGITEMIPDILLALREPAADEHGLIERSLVAWMRRHEVEITPDLLAEASLRSLRAGHPRNGAFALLVERDPERAWAVLAQVAKDDADGSALREGFTGAAFVDVPRARIAQLCELILARMSLDEAARMSLYMRVPITPCRSIEDDDARAEDLRALAAMLRRQLALEQGAGARRILESVVGRVEAGAG